MRSTIAFMYHGASMARAIFLMKPACQRHAVCATVMLRILADLRTSFFISNSGLPCKKILITDLKHGSGSLKLTGTNLWRLAIASLAHFARRTTENYGNGAHLRDGIRNCSTGDHRGMKNGKNWAGRFIVIMRSMNARLLAEKSCNGSVVYTLLGFTCNDGAYRKFLKRGNDSFLQRVGTQIRLRGSPAVYRLVSGLFQVQILAHALNFKKRSIRKRSSLT